MFLSLLGHLINHINATCFKVGSVTNANIKLVPCYKLVQEAIFHLVLIGKTCMTVYLNLLTIYSKLV